MTNNETIVVVNGFDDIQNDDTNPDGRLKWYCAPDCWVKDGLVVEGRREGRDGKWWLCDASSERGGQHLVVVPPAKKDFWRKTYYEPVLVKDDGPVLYCALSVSKFYTVEASFVLAAARQFDQAGICLRLDHEHWIKTGIEVVDRKPRLSCVVTNVYSDWSTQKWNDNGGGGGDSGCNDNNKDDDEPLKVSARIRVHCMGSSFVIESKPPAAGRGEEEEEWEFIRIAHMSKLLTISPQPPAAQEDPLAEHPNVTGAWQGPSPAAAAGEFWAGVFACCPEDQQGSSATFTHFKISEGSRFDHDADGVQE